jgi:putative copper export protein
MVIAKVTANWPTALLITLAAVVVALGIILFAVHKLRPKSFRLTASVSRWLQLTLEIEAPQRSNRGSPGGR